MCQNAFPTITTVNMAHYQGCVNREIYLFLYGGIYLCVKNIYVYFIFNNFSSKAKSLDFDFAALTWSIQSTI